MRDGVCRTNGRTEEPRVIRGRTRYGWRTLELAVHGARAGDGDLWSDEQRTHRLPSRQFAGYVRHYLNRRCRVSTVVPLLTCGRIRAAPPTLHAQPLYQNCDPVHSPGRSPVV